ncbi:hypothetical protein GCM10022600_20400 [Qipengyuania pelagi]
MHGADLKKPGIIHFPGDGTQFAFGDLAIFPNLLFQHRPHSGKGGGERRPSIARLEPIGGAERKAHINASSIEQIMNPAPPENVAAAIHMLERSHWTDLSRTARWHTQVHNWAFRTGVIQ